MTSSAPAALGKTLTHAGHRIGGEILKVSGLLPGQYEIVIDGKNIGKTVAHTTLGAKVELQDIPETPEYVQALEVALLNRERNDKAIRPLRDTWGKIKGLRNQVSSAKPEDRPRLEKELSAKILSTGELIALSAEYEGRIHQLAQPATRTYEVRMVQSSGGKK